MGSVQTPTKCPDCNYEEAIEDFYYKTGEMFVTCPRCGYAYQNIYVRDKEGNVLKDEQGQYRTKETEQHGAGVFEMKKEGKLGTAIGHLFQDKEKRKRQILVLKEIDEKNEGTTVKIKEYTKHMVKE